MTSIGIDLGTTNSAMARYDAAPGRSEILENSQAQRITPSVVAVRRQKDGREQTLVGEPAVRAGTSVVETVFSVKRLMGRTVGEEDVEQVCRRFGYRIAPLSDDDATVTIQMGEHARTPQDISAAILEKLRKDATTRLGQEVSRAVITVPAYFENAQRTATRAAAEAAGLVVGRLIDEPTAAAVAYGMSDPSADGRRVLVYDLGGGTFDVSVLNMVVDDTGHGQFQVVGTGGDNWLGGDDFDDVIAQKVLAEVEAKHRTPAPEDGMFRRLLKQAAEQAKRQLSEVDVGEVGIPAAFRLIDGGPLIDVWVEVTREEFERGIGDLVARTMNEVDKVMADGNFVAEDITDVLLVGGSTLVPAVRSAVSARFGAGKLRAGVPPMECVALGAAVVAATTGVQCPACETDNDPEATTCASCGHELEGGVATAPMTLYEQTPMHMGIAAVDGEDLDAFVPIIPKGTPYPLREPMRQTFTADRRAVRVPVYEGVHDVASRNRLQGMLEVTLPEGLEAGSEVEVSFGYDQSRILTVAVSVPGTTFRQSETIRTQAPAPATANPDESRDELERTIDFTQGFVHRYGDYIEPFQVQRLRRRLTDAQEAAESRDPATHQQSVDTLHRDVDNCGLATSLFLADLAADRAAPDTAARIRETAEVARKAHREGQNPQRAEAERTLMDLVRRELERPDRGATPPEAADLLRRRR